MITEQMKLAEILHNKLGQIEVILLRICDLLAEENPTGKIFNEAIAELQAEEKDSIHQLFKKE